MELFFNDGVEARTLCAAFKLSRLLIEPLQGTYLFRMAQLRFLNRRLQYSDCFVIDTDRYRKRMAVLATMRKGKPRWIREATWRSMHDFRHHGQGANSSSSDSLN